MDVIDSSRFCATRGRTRQLDQTVRMSTIICFQSSGFHTYYVFTQDIPSSTLISCKFHFRMLDTALLDCGSLQEETKCGRLEVIVDMKPTT